MLVVWGGIAYQIMNGMSPDEVLQNISQKTLIKPVVEKETVRYELALDYEDPFRVSSSLKNLNRSINSTVNSTIPNRKSTPLVEKKEIQWPFIKYGGKVKSSNNKEVGLLTIAGRSFLVKKGQTVKKVTVKDYSEENISLEYMNEQKVISK